MPVTSITKHPGPRANAHSSSLPENLPALSTLRCVTTAYELASEGVHIHLDGAMTSDLAFIGQLLEGSNENG
jgi:hypothetical protein